MPRLSIPLTELQCRTAKPRERAYKLFDGGGMYLFVKPNGVKTWRLKYTVIRGQTTIHGLNEYADAKLIVVCPRLSWIAHNA